MQKIKKDDLVVVIAGKDKDKQGKVLSVDVKKNKVLVQGCNMVTKHTKQSPANPQGGIVNQEAPIDISNVMTARQPGSDLKKKTARRFA